MKLIIDSREVLPLSFQHPFITEILIEKLSVGDYCARFTDNYQVPIIFERKGIGDLYSTMFNDYDRFKKEIIRARENNITLILIIEGTFTKVLKGYEHSSVEGITMIRKLFTLWIRYNLYPVFCRDREEMVNYITEFYIAIGKQHIKDIKIKSKESVPVIPK